MKSVDWISKLPNDVLLMILSRLCTREAVETSVVSKQWEHVWKQVSYLVFDKPKTTNSTKLPYGSNLDDTLITKVGSLLSSVSFFFFGILLLTLWWFLKGYKESPGTYRELCHQLFLILRLNGILNTWIQSLTSEKHTKVLTLIRILIVGIELENSSSFNQTHSVIQASCHSP